MAFSPRKYKVHLLSASQDLGQQNIDAAMYRCTAPEQLSLLLAVVRANPTLNRQNTVVVTQCSLGGNAEWHVKVAP